MRVDPALAGITTNIDVCPSVASVWVSDEPGPSVALTYRGERQRRRRSEVLATVRRMIAEKGFDLDLRTIASECEVSVQTLYNQIGNRHELFRAAILDHIHRIAHHACTDPRYPNPIVAMADLNYRYTLQDPSYVWNVCRQSLPVSGQFHLDVLGEAMKLYLHLLRQMRRSGDFLEGVELQPLAEAAASANMGVCFEWAAGAFPGKASRWRFASRVGLLLQGRLAPEGARALDHWIEQTRYN